VMVQRLADPGLVPTSQEPGIWGVTNSAAMTAPGSEPITPLPAPIGGQGAVPGMSGPEIPVPNTRQPAAGVPAEGSRWTYTTASGRN
jgi:hypothetical protein